MNLMLLNQGTNSVNHMSSDFVEKLILQKTSIKVVYHRNSFLFFFGFVRFHAVFVTRLADNVNISCRPRIYHGITLIAIASIFQSQKAKGSREKQRTKGFCKQV